jgi:hypothetical protein
MNHSVRNEHWRYIRYKDGSEELYDHRKDPYEWKNLAGVDDWVAVKKRLATRLPQTNAPNTPIKKNLKKAKKNKKEG